MQGWETDVVRWLLSPAARSLTAEALFEGVAEQVSAAGPVLERMASSIPAKHPELFVLAIVWSRGAPVQVNRRVRTLTSTPGFLNSPVRALLGGAQQVRCRLVGPGADLTFPVCAELAAEGLTDYLALPLHFANGHRSFVSFATRQEGGFEDAHLVGLANLCDALSLRVELASTVLATSSLLEVYLGANAARRVVAGGFHRGSGEVLPAAIFYCDLRGFTAMADQRTPREVVATLDAFFDHVAAPIHARGGEILKFIGDAVLAVFTTEEGGAAACRAACEAAREALAAIDRWNGSRAAVGDPPLRLGIALHRGELFYGNIGAQDRLDFTVIGRAVNEASRIESLCKSLGVPVLITAAVREAAREVPMVPVGRQALRGVATDVELFTFLPDPE